MEDIKPVPPEGYTSFVSYAQSLLKEKEIERRIEILLKERLKERKRRMKRGKLTTLGILSIWLITLLVYLLK